MKFLRENVFLIAVAGIVLVGGGGLLAGYAMISEKVDKAVEQRTTMARTLKGLEDNGANADMADAAKVYIGVIEASAGTVKDKCIQWNRAQMQVLALPIPGSAPKPAFPYDEQDYRDRGLGYVFTKTYVEAMQGLLNSLRPTAPPTDGEIQSQQVQWQNRLMQWKLLEVGKSPPIGGFRPEGEETEEGMAYNPTLAPLPTPETTGMYAPTTPYSPTGVDPAVAEEATRKGRDSAMLLKARRGAVYTDPSALDMVFTEAMPNPTVESLWRAQLNLWVSSDIIAAINATNQDAFSKVPSGASHDVLAAAVKRLALIDVNETYVLPPAEMTAAPTGSTIDDEREVEDYSTGPAQGRRDQASVLTKRGSTKDYDVLHYRFIVVMASRYLPVLENHLLSRNYHTILSVQIHPANAPIASVSAEGRAGYSSMASENYYYGPEPVVQVEIEGEVLLLTAWERGTWDNETQAWSPQFPPLIPAEAIKQQYDRESPALRPEDVARYPQETDTTGGGTM